MAQSEAFNRLDDAASGSARNPAQAMPVGSWIGFFSGLARGKGGLLILAAAFGLLALLLVWAFS